MADGLSSAMGSRAGGPLVKLVDHVFHPRIHYFAKDFDEQEGFRFTFEIGTGQKIETGVYLHWLQGKPVDVAVDLSCMSGCTKGCFFCAAAVLLPPTVLEPEQILAQALDALARVRRIEPNFMTALPKITFSFEGIGEPCDMATEIVAAIRLLKQEFGAAPTQFIVSTTLDRTSALAQWLPPEVQLHSLQFSLHVANHEKRQALVSQRLKTPVATIFEALDRFAERSPQTQIKINYVLMQGKNDGEEDIDALMTFLSSRPAFYLKVAYLNETGPASNAGLRPVADASSQSFYEKCKARHDRTYRYGSFRQIDISCGQLASYAYGARLNATDKDNIRELHQQIVSGTCTLFLGAGASHTALDASGLKDELARLGNLSRENTEQLSLSEVADILDQRGLRLKVQELIQEKLQRAAVPRATLKLVRFPWRSIYTTNYDRLVERAFEEMVKQGFATKACHPVRQLSELGGIPLNAIPLIKLHGCISNGQKTVLSTTDYLDGYEASIEMLFKRFELDRLQGSALFIGYSFRDAYINQQLVRLNQLAGNRGGRIWAVIPESWRSAYDRESLKDKFGISLITMTFQDLMDQLDLCRRQPVLMASGSVKRAVSGKSSEARPDVTVQVKQLCSLIANGLDSLHIQLVTGATACNKVGYLIGSQMQTKADRVRTYTWFGADQVGENEIHKMIGVKSFGHRPADVVARLLAESNVFLIIGGGGLALREAQAAMAQATPVIPVAVGGAYASDVIRGFFLQQRRSIKVLGQDSGIDANVAHDGSRILTTERLNRLDLTTHTPEVVAATVLETLEHALAVVGQVPIADGSNARRSLATFSASPS